MSRHVTSEGSAVFSPEAVTDINLAYAEALEVLEREGLQGEMREQLAEEMMQLAKSGERDKERLCRFALKRTLKRRPINVVYSGL